MRHFVRFIIPVALCALLVAPAAAGGVDAVTVECGIFRDYTVPDPGTATAGSITFGLTGAPEVIAADATLVPPADTALPSLQGGAPTALTVVRNSGVITSLAFAAACTISGTPVLVPDLFGPGQSAYVVADRLFAPFDQVSGNAGLGALIGTAAASGVAFSITFLIDVGFGAPSGFTATTTFSGAVVMLAAGDVQVGAATLPNSVIGDEARADLHSAAELGVDATVVVDGVGSIDQSSKDGVVVDITLMVTFVAPPPTAPAPSPTQGSLPDTAMDAADSR